MTKMTSNPLKSARKLETSKMTKILETVKITKIFGYTASLSGFRGIVVIFKVLEVKE